MEKLIDNFDKRISPISNPFRKDCISGIYMSASRGPFTGRINVTGRVEFTNGKTRGEQSFEADDLAELYSKMADFCNNL